MFSLTVLGMYFLVPGFGQSHSSTDTFRITLVSVPFVVLDEALLLPGGGVSLALAESDVSDCRKFL